MTVNFSFRPTATPPTETFAVHDGHEKLRFFQEVAPFVHQTSPQLHKVGAEVGRLGGTARRIR